MCGVSGYYYGKLTRTVGSPIPKWYVDNSVVIVVVIVVAVVNVV